MSLQVSQQNSSRTVLCRKLELLGRSDQLAEKRKKEAVYWIGLGLALGLMQIVFSGSFPKSPARDFEMGVFLTAAVSGLFGVGMLMLGQARDLIDRRYLPLLYLFSQGTFLAEEGLTLKGCFKRQESPTETWAVLTGALKDGGQFALKLSTRYWTESDRIQQEYEVDNPNYNVDGAFRDDRRTITKTREVVVHRREFEQDRIQFSLTRTPEWNVAALQRHLMESAGPHLALEECVCEPGRLEANFVSGIARTVSGEGMLSETLDFDRLLDSQSLLQVFQWFQQGEARLAESESFRPPESRSIPTG